jgi:NADH:ubiquinone oxidoreductase subunit K
MNVTLVHVLFLGAALFATGAFTTAYRTSFSSALAGVAIMLAGAGLDLVGVARYAASINDPLAGQELAVLLAGLALATVAVGSALARPEAGR